jgi:hypothetical protein
MLSLKAGARPRFQSISLNTMPFNILNNDHLACAFSTVRWNIPKDEPHAINKPSALGFGQIVTLLLLLLPFFTIFLVYQGKFF